MHADRRRVDGAGQRQSADALRRLLRDDRLARTARPGDARGRLAALPRRALAARQCIAATAIGLGQSARLAVLLRHRRAGLSCRALRRHGDVVARQTSLTRYGVGIVDGMALRAAALVACVAHGVGRTAPRTLPDARHDQFCDPACGAHHRHFYYANAIQRQKADGVVWVPDDATVPGNENGKASSKRFSHRTMRRSSPDSRCCASAIPNSKPSANNSRTRAWRAPRSPSMRR